MTPIARLLKQKTALCLRAFEHTQDLNEAYFLVHGVMAGALSRVEGPEPNLGPNLGPDLGLAMTDALDARARHLFHTEAMV
jgi:hypothetical protein